MPAQHLVGADSSRRRVSEWLDARIGRADAPFEVSRDLFEDEVFVKSVRSSRIIWISSPRSLHTTAAGRVSSASRGQSAHLPSAIDCKTAATSERGDVGVSAVYA